MIQTSNVRQTTRSDPRKGWRYSLTGLPCADGAVHTLAVEFGCALNLRRQWNQRRSHYGSASSWRRAAEALAGSSVRKADGTAAISIGTRWSAGNTRAVIRPGIERLSR